MFYWLTFIQRHVYRNITRIMVQWSDRDGHYEWPEDRSIQHWEYISSQIFLKSTDFFIFIFFSHLSWILELSPFRNGPGGPILRQRAYRCGVAPFNADTTQLSHVLHAMTSQSTDVCSSRYWQTGNWRQFYRRRCLKYQRIIWYVREDGWEDLSFNICLDLMPIKFMPASLVLFNWICRTRIIIDIIMEA